MTSNIKQGISMAFAAICVASSNTNAGVLRGSVTDSDNQPLAGAIISLSDKRGVSEAVYSDEKGAFNLRVSTISGELSLLVRKRYYADNQDTIQLGTTSEAKLAVKLAPLKTEKELSEDHPALSFYSRVNFDKDPKSRNSRGEFSRDCLSCHQLGNKMTRIPRSPEGWAPTITRMHSYLGIQDEELTNQRAKMLSEGFSNQLMTSMPQNPYDPLLAKAKIYRWRLDGANVPHDADVHSKNGKVYTVDMFAGKIIETNLHTGDSVEYTEPAQGMPPGGAYTQRGLPVPFGLTVPRAPHSLAEGKNGNYYLTDSLGASIGEFNPVTKSFKHYPLGGDALYPHSIRVDGKGIVWATVAFSNHVARFDPESEDMKIIELPVNTVDGKPARQQPYGIDFNPMDGSIWYTNLLGDMIGRIDSKTLEVKLYNSPVIGPRRGRFDDMGNFWVAGFSSGEVARINVEKWELKVYKLPVFAPDEIPAPYALAIDPKTKDIWVNDTMLDLVWRFLPGEERFVAYPLPLKGSYTRDFDFTTEGWACTSNNPIPAASLEGFEPELICIDPNS